MLGKVRILFLSANPWTTSRILVDEEAREVFERLQEGPFRSRFELHKHAATRPVDLQRLLLLYEPQIVHFSGHGTKRQKLIFGGVASRGKTVDSTGLAEVFALYKGHLKLVLLNACFTKLQARSIAQVIDYSVGTGKGIGDKAGVAFAGAFYRALGFGRSVRAAFESAKAELALTKMPRTQGIELFVREGLNGNDLFPSSSELQDHAFDELLGSDTSDGPSSSSSVNNRSVLRRIEHRSEMELTVTDIDGVTTIKKTIRVETTEYRASQQEPFSRH